MRQKGRWLLSYESCAVIRKAVKTVKRCGCECTMKGGAVPVATGLLTIPMGSLFDELRRVIHSTEK